MDWRVSEAPVPYEEAITFMEDRVAQIRQGTAPDTVWILEHPSLYTAGTSAKAVDLVDPQRFPVHDSGRGGQYTYHGPGQRVAYVMMDLTHQGSDLRKFVRNLEAWLIETLAQLGIDGERRDGRVGIWIDRGQGREDKIAAIGIRVRRWVSYHGISLNVSPDLSHYDGIVPCGIEGHGVTSLKDLGVDATMTQVDDALKAAFERQFKMSR